MKTKSKIIQNYYRNQRELFSFAIMDIEKELIFLAENGVSHCLLLMQDISDSERVLVEHYTTMYQGVQRYDYITEEDIEKIMKKKGDDVWVN